MLILRRKVGEKIVIGDGIVVVVSRVSGGRVTIGIEAPAEVHIVRGELKAIEGPHRPPPAAKMMRDCEIPSVSSAAPAPSAAAAAPVVHPLLSPHVHH